MPPSVVLRPTLLHAAARAIADAAWAEALRRNVAVSLVILDNAARPLVVDTMDDAPLGAFDVALAKARHAVLFRRPTKFQESLLIEGKLQVLGVPNMIPLEGGLPIESHGGLAGAIGVSGAAASVDGEVAAAGLAWLQSANED